MWQTHQLVPRLRARITLLACDAELSPAAPWVFEPWEEFTLPDDIRGGGGTRFTPPFERVELEGTVPDLLVYFTDAEGEFPGQEPRFPSSGWSRDARRYPGDSAST